LGNLVAHGEISLRTAIAFRAGRRHAALGLGGDESCFYGEPRSLGFLPAASSTSFVSLPSLSTMLGFF